MKEDLLPGFTMTLDRQGFLSWRLTTRQLLPLSPEETFVFFRNPSNLEKLVPESLEFTLVGPRENVELHEGAVFNYAIRLYGIQVKWQGRIVEYLPPRLFTDIQVTGPYKAWRHRHAFEPDPDGTLLNEEVTYRIPLEGLLLEQTINRQLRELFTYRAARLAAWATDAAQRERQGEGLS